MYNGENEIKAQVKEADPNFNNQTIDPDAGYDYLLKVNVAAIEIIRTPNEFGGITVTVN